MRWISALIACCLLVVPCLADVKLTPSKPSSATSGPARGLVWKLEGGAVPVYLAGSFHLLRPQDFPLPTAYDTAYSAAKSLTFEVAPNELESPALQLKMMEKAMLPLNTSLAKQVSKETMKLLEEHPSAEGMLDQFQRFRPWMVALILAMNEYKELGADAAKGLEKTFQAKGDKDGKEMAGFESGEFQIGLFSAFTPKEQETLLKQTLLELSQTKTLITKMLTAWRTGDETALADLLDEGFKGYPEIKEKMLLQRNANWVPKIEELAKGTKPALVIVGAGHLCGSKSVIELLQQKGWKLTRVEK